MSASTILTMANGKGIDLLAVCAADIDFPTIAEHLGKEKRFNGATPDVEYSVAQHLALGADAIIANGGTELEAAYFLLHDVPEAFWKDDPTPKKEAIAERVADRCGVTASAVLSVFKELDTEHEAAVHEAAGLPYPVPEEIHAIVKLHDVIMFVTEWRDLMHDVHHPNWAAFAGVKPLSQKIEPWPWAQARAAWLYRANRLLPSLLQHRPVVAEPYPLAQGQSK
jgi:hypothetical protein